MSRTLSTYFQIDETVADRVTSFELVRELGRPAVLDIEVRFAEDTSAANALGKQAYLRFGYPDEPAHEMMGIVQAVTTVGSPATGGVGVLESGSMHAVKLRVVSQIALLDGNVTACIYQDKDVKEIVTAVLEANGIPSDRQKWQLAGSYAKREYCVQFFESSLAFVSRLLEEEGIFFSSLVEDENEIIVFGDDSPASAPIDGEAEVPFRGQLGFDSKSDAIFAMRELAMVRSGKFTLRDYDFKRPQLDMTVEAEADASTNLERYDYPGLYVEPAVGKQLATVRLQAEQVDHETSEVLADSPRLYPGRVFSIIETPFDDMSGEVMVARVVHCYGKRSAKLFEHFSVPSSASRGEPGDDLYVAEAKLIGKDIKFRTAQTTPRPIAHGPQTARVVAPAGAEVESIHTDEHGRCKVKFHWDLAPDEDDKASCWMRTGQLQTSGSMVLPRIGWEVVVEYLEGNPDRPVVTGKLYNGLFMPPYALPEGKTRTSMQSSSTPGGGGSNEIRMEDRAGGEEIMMHAQHNQTVATANNKKSLVGNNATRVVGANETITIGANQTVKITMGSETTVTGDQTVSVGGNRNTEVNAVTSLNASGSSSTSVGGNHFEMDGNPLEALLAIAAEAAIAAAEAAASAALDRVNAAIQDRVDQVMGPINELTGQLEQVGAAMEAVGNGDVGAIAGMAADAAGLPMPPGFGGDEAGGGGEEGGGGEGGEEEAPEPSYTEQLGVDAAVNSAVEQGIHGAAGALGAALGLDAAGSGGESMANAEGPVGDVPGVDQTDRAKGPGHSLHKIDASLSEDIGSLRIQASIQAIHTEVAGNMTEDVSLAKVTAMFGNITETTTGNKTTNALGTIVFAKGGETENAGGNSMTMVGGLIYDKVGGGYSIEGGGPTTFMGAFHKMEAATAITFKCGASEVVIDDSGITITSPLVAVLSSKIEMTKAVAQV